ncbi:epithelial sodium channel subunit alpha-like [Oculina patagonica]
MEKNGDNRAANEKTSAKEKPASVKRLLADFCGYTTAHGLGRLSESKNICSRLIWSLFCIGAFTMFVLQVYNLFVIYLSRPVSTVVKVEHESRAKFPAVTICNMNMLRAGELPDSYIQDILETLTPYANESSLNEQANNTSSNASLSADDDIYFESSGEEQYIDDEESGYFGSSTEEAKEIESQIEEALLAKVAKENDSMLFALGHQFKDFVFQCSFRGYDCRNYTRYWHNFWDFRFGNCFTFNGGINDYGESQKVLQSFNTGPAGGLKLKLFIEQSQYIAELSHTAGARVVIHDQGQMPFPDNEGHDVLPSRSTSIAIRKTVVERVDPFGNGSCISEDDFKDKNIYAKKFNTSYSRQACLNSCLANKQILECGCAEAQFPADAEICDITNSSTAKCLDSLLRDLLSGELNCEANCPTPCSEVLFRTSLSMGEWPSFGYEEILEQRVQDREVYTSEGDFGYYLSENFLQVRIFFEQLNFERVVESVSYQRVNLVADIGGQLGLWIGISVLTCCELFELILLIIRSVFTKMFSSNVIHVKPASN